MSDGRFLRDLTGAWKVALLFSLISGPAIWLMFFRQVVPFPGGLAPGVALGLALHALWAALSFPWQRALLFYLGVIPALLILLMTAAALAGVALGIENVALYTPFAALIVFLLLCLPVLGRISVSGRRKFVPRTDAVFAEGSAGAFLYKAMADMNRNRLYALYDRAEDGEETVCIPRGKPILGMKELRIRLVSETAPQSRTVASRMLCGRRWRASEERIDIEDHGTTAEARLRLTMRLSPIAWLTLWLTDFVGVVLEAQMRWADGQESTSSYGQYVERFVARHSVDSAEDTA